MSFIPTSTSQLLSSFNQLTQATSEATVASSLTRVAVSQVLSNQLTLATTRQSFTLPSERLTGKLEAGKNYAANLETNISGTRLNFYPTELRSPQLLSRSASESIITQLPTLLNQQQIEDVLELQAKTTKVSQQQISLNVNGKEVSFDLKNANQRFAANQAVRLTLKTAPDGWLVSLQPESQATSIILVKVSPTQALTILGTVPSKTFQISDGQLTLPNQKTTNAAATSQLNPSQQNATIVNSTSTLSTTSNATPPNLSLSINRSGLVQLTPVPPPLASIPINDKDAVALTQGGIKQITSSQISTPISRDTVSIQSQSGGALVSRSDPTQTTVKTEAVINTSTPSGSGVYKTVSLPVEVQQQIVSLIRQSQPLQDSPSQSITRLINLLDDPIIAKDPALLNELKGIKTQLQSVTTNADNPNIEERVRQVISTAPAPITTQQLTSPSTNSHFLSGIIGLLQLSLSAKLAQNKPANIERLAQALAPILSSPLVGAASPTPTKTSLAKRLSDWLQLEQKHQGLQEINKLLANHQTGKLASIEQQAQGLETLYYVLPIGTGEQNQDAEILIKREPENNNEQENDSQRRAWQLTMKLDIGEKGQILSKAHLRESELELDFYASNQELLNDVLNFLPYLKIRFESLGILVTKRSCQLGKIPDHLYQRPYHILETHV